jgi:UDP-N-acetylglucosamine 2-epimerase (non-hydrolysing)
VTSQTTPVVCLLVGTRPEAIKIAPIVHQMRQDGRLEPVLVSTSQQAHLIDDTLAAFDLAPDVTIPLVRDTGSITELTARLLPELETLLTRLAPRAVVVQGDTATAMVGGLAAFWQHIPVVHVEAGLRSGRLDAPFPEEANRKIISQVCSLHLPPTGLALRNLQREGIAGEDVLVTGNTSVDAILGMAGMQRPYDIPELEEIEASGRRIVLVTCHRREIWGEPMRRLLAAVRTLAETHPDIHIVLPAHPNPAVRSDVHAALDGMDRILVCEPLSYPSLARLLRSATLVLSDSGGIQEEAPSFGVPVLVMRDVTERMEAVEAGCARLVGVDPDVVMAAATRALAMSPRLGRMTRSQNPFGDGHASRRIVDAIAWRLGLGTRPAPFMPGSVAPEHQPVDIERVPAVA